MVWTDPAMMGLINDAAHVSICSYSAASIVVAVKGPLSDSSFLHSALLEPSPEKKPSPDDGGVQGSQKHRRALRFV